MALGPFGPLSSFSFILTTVVTQLSLTGQHLCLAIPTPTLAIPTPTSPTLIIKDIDFAHQDDLSDESEIVPNFEDSEEEQTINLIELLLDKLIIKTLKNQAKSSSWQESSSRPRGEQKKRRRKSKLRSWRRRSKPGPGELNPFPRVG